MNQSDRLFQQGLAFLNQGKLQQARENFEKVVKINHRQFDAFNLLGIIAAQLKEFELAKNFFEKAIKINPSNATFHCNQGNVFKELKQLEEAVNSYDKAITLNKEYALAYCNRSTALNELNRHEEALISSEHAIKINSNYAEAHHQHAVNLAKLKLFQESLASYDKAIELKPDFAQAYFGSGDVLNELKRFEEALASYDKAIELIPEYAEAYANRGIVLYELKRFEHSLASYDKATELNPEDAQTYFNRGNVLNELKRFEEALASYDKAIELIPEYAEAYANRGIVLYELKRFELSLASYDKAIELKTDYAVAYSNRANSFKELKRFEDALTSYNKAIELMPDYADAHLNKSILLLSQQDFENGWRLYEWRWKSKSYSSLPISTKKPKWVNLQPNFVSNKKILIWSEQGVGDQVLYSSMLDRLFKVAPLSQVMLDKRLLPLFERSIPQGKFLDNKIPTEDIEYDEHLPIADLGEYFRTCSTDFDNQRNSFLKADPSRANEIRKSLIGNNKFLCGITWSSKVETIGNEKSIQLADLLPVLSLNHIAFVNLQYGDVQGQLIEFNQKHNINIQECLSVDNFNDLDGHAALIQACDFVVTISNTSAHIAGAIGKETYLMCSSGKGMLWYWSNQLNGKSLWYPSIYIYEQNVIGQWFDVVQRVKLAIEKKINEIE